MTNNNLILNEIKSSILHIAESHNPEGTDSDAVVDQWLHALASDSQFYCNLGISTPTNLKNEVLSLLKSKGLYDDRTSLYETVFRDLNLKPFKDPKFRFIDLFAGIGGLRLGFQNTGGSCVFSSERDKHAQTTYKLNHGETPFGDITLINPRHIPDHDILLAGFPCQPFSHAGLKLGIDDTRGTLFHNIASILEVKKPKYVVLENVKGLISHDKGHTIKVILNTLIKLGYSCNIPKEIITDGSTKQIQELAKKMILKSIDFGVPQNRQRIYIVLWRDGLIDNFEYPKARNKEFLVGDILEDSPDPKLTISDRLWAGHQRRKIQNKKNGKGFGYGLVSTNSPYTNTISARYYKDGSEVLIEQEGQNPRKLSTREAARLQGFPDSFKLHTSDIQAYKQLGNSVTVNVVQALAEQLTRYIL